MALHDAAAGGTAMPQAYCDMLCREDALAQLHHPACNARPTRQGMQTQTMVGLQRRIRTCT